MSFVAVAVVGTAVSVGGTVYAAGQQKKAEKRARSR